MQKVVLITVNYCLCCRKKLHLFIFLCQMRRNGELGPIAILERFFNEQYAKSLLSLFQQNKWGCRNNRGLFSWYGMVRSSDVEKKVLKRDWATWSALSAGRRGRAGRSIWLCKWRGGWFASNIDQCYQPGRRVSFFIGHSLRFGWFIEIIFKIPLIILLSLCHEPPQDGNKRCI